MSFDWQAGDTTNFQSHVDPLRRLGLTHIESFRLEEQIGEGGMGVVYRAWDEAVGRPVAIKLLLAGARANENQRRRFQRELQTLGSLRHPSLLTVHRSGEVQGIPYMATEWLEGEDLGARIRREGPLPVEEAVAVLVEVARAVGYAHDHGILHRDIKPDNVVLEPGRGPVLLDFGLAKQVDPEASRVTRSGTFAGTLGFAAPEQLLDASSVDERADVYSLGATLFCCLCGESPADRLDGLTELLTAAAAGRLPTPRQLNASCPRELDAIVKRTMRPEPDDRYETAFELADALERFAATGGRRELPAAAKWTAGGLVAAAVVAGAFLAGRTSSSPPPPASPTATPGGGGSAGSPAPSPAPKLGVGLDWRDQKIAEVHAQLDQLFVVVARDGPVDEGRWKQQQRELRRLLSTAILTARKGDGPQAPLRLGAALADAGRYPEALEALEQPRRSGDPRAGLTWASTRFVQAVAKGESTPDVLTAVRRVGAADPEGDPDRRAAIEMARVWSEFLLDRRPSREQLRGWIGRVTQLIDAESPTWLGREAWIALAAFLMRTPGPQARVDLSHPLIQLDKRFTSPWWSQAFTEVWLRGWGSVRLTAPLLNRLDFMVTLAPTRDRIETFAKLAASGGLLGTLRRLEDLRAGVDMGPMRRVAEEISARESEAPRSSRFVVRGAWLGIRIRPSAIRTRVLWQFPPGGWTLRARGAETDIDLLVRVDGPPRAGGPETRGARSMARDEQVSSDAELPSSGLHQVVIERSNPWPEPLSLDLELVGPQAPKWESPWGFKSTRGHLPEAVKALARARKLNQSGRLGAAVQVVRRLEQKLPELVLVRASMLANAGAWERLRRLHDQVRSPDPKVQRALDFEGARALLALGEPIAAQELLEQLLKREPNLLAAREELALAQLGRGRLLSALATLRRITKRDPKQVHAQTLQTAVAALCEKGDFVPKILALKQVARRRVRARELLARGLLFAKHPKLVLALLEERSPPREQLWRLEALIALRRQADARSLLARLRETPLAAFRKRRLEELAQRLGS